MITDIKTKSPSIQQYKETLQKQKEKLLQSIVSAADISFIRLFGNRGDDLIYAGARQLLAKVKYKELNPFHLQSIRGDTAIIAGSGGWCGPYGDLPEYLPIIEKRFKQVIVFPSSYDISIPSVRNAMENSKALFFAREEFSYNRIKTICNADIAYDTAFFFDYSPYQRNGTGKLNAYRTDKEAAGSVIPLDNDDISLTCESLDEWLWKISGVEEVYTDRAHVMIAGALLGKHVEYRSSNYHKVPAIADYSLKDFPVYREEMSLLPDHKSKPGSIVDTQNKNESFSEPKQIRKCLFEIMNVVAPSDRFILIDDEHIRFALGKTTTAIPFLEQDGLYWGPPQNDETAIQEFNRLYNTGLSHLIITWSAFWWIEHYKTWYQYLRSNFKLVLENERLIVFDLKDKNHQA